MNCKTILFPLALSLSAASYAAPSYDNFYISYISPAATKSITDYVKEKQLRGLIFWEFRGDTGFGEPTSLLSAMHEGLASYQVNGKSPMIMGYWSDWNVYSADPSTRAIPQPAYAVPGSLDGNNQKVTNDDFQQKLKGMNMIAYSFVEAQTKQFTYYDNQSGSMVTVENQTPENIGTLYFNDPWADLSKPGQSQVQDAFCAQHADICGFALTNRNQPIEFKEGVQMGNFNAFTALKRDAASDNLGPLQKVISIGGYGHDASFEDAFNSPNGIDNFVNSAKAIVDGYQLDGIDLDYENPNVNSQQTRKYAELVKRLAEAMPDKMISVTIMSGPEYVNSTSDRGFSPEVLGEIANYATTINLMTYDFYGAFSYDANHPEASVTAFLTNLTLPENAPASYQFSIEKSVDAALAAGVKPEQLTVGIPAYGRALAGIDGSSNGGLFAPITSSATIPRGDLDAASCSTAISPLGPNSCSGSFQYSYIVNQLLKNGLEATDHFDGDRITGTTAYAKKWSPAADDQYRLEITNTGSGSDTAFNVKIGDFVAADFFNLGTDKTYEGQSTASISGKKGLSVSWYTSWGPEGTCEAPLDFTQNTHIMIRVTPDNATGTYKTTCEYKPL